MKKDKKEKKEKKEKKGKPKKEKNPKKQGGAGEQEKKSPPPPPPSGGGDVAAEEPKRHWLNLSTAFLHLLAMGLMLCDHMWATLFPAADWLTCLGRIAYPIFAFLLVEGYFHTQNLWRYMLRLLGAAVLSEIPFNLMYSDSFIYPYHQNVLWTYIIGLLLITLLEEFKERFGQIPWLIFLPVPAFLGYFLGYALMTDYYGPGVLMILAFYLFRGRHWLHFLGQLVCLYLINVKMLGGFYYVVPLLRYDIEIVQQGFALFALLPIWLYEGRQGLHGKLFRWFCYLFYPVHMLVLFLIRWRILG